MTFNMLIPLSVLLILSGGRLLTAQQDVDTTLSCAADLPIPGYVGVLWTAQAEGEAEVMIAIGNGGIPTSINVHVRQGATILGPWLKAALERANFRERCAGRTMEIKFIYRLKGGPDTEPHNEITFRGSNIFQIVGHRPVPNVQP
jgi:hypothetical protein